MKIILKSALIFCLFLTLIPGCKKEEPQPAEDPEPTPTPTPNPTVTPTPTVDPFTYSADLTSSQEISFANLAIADIEMMGAYMGEGILSNYYFSANTSVPSPGTITAIRDTTQKALVIGFNKTKCRDGKVREGSAFFMYAYHPVTNPMANPNSRYYRDFGFVANVTLSEYKVNDWKIELFDFSKPAYITNKISSAAYNPAVTNLSWEFKGKFKFTHTDGRVIIWDGTLIKTLTNTSSPTVFAVDKKSAINWSKAVMSYAGTVTGTTSGNIPFNYAIETGKLLIRDFNCNYIPAASTTVAESHPFINGVASFSTSTHHPRSINHGPANACDNSGTISFKDESHTVTFE